MPRFILVTGMMGSGKSVVSELLRKKHYIVIDSDSEVKALYEDPEIYQYLIAHLGKDILTNTGKIDFAKMRAVFANSEVAGDDIMHRLLVKFTNNLIEKYRNNKEVVFIEAALTPQVQRVRAKLEIFDMVIVHADDEIRKARIEARGNFMDKNMEILASYQSMENLSPVATGINVPNHAVIHIDNNGTLEELNDKLVYVLQNLGITHQEKLATYLRYLKEAPSYCHDNAWCYSFFNLGGCNNCPFPCSQFDKNYQKLNAKFIEEQKKAYSPEVMYSKFIQAWADDYNQAQKDSKEFFVR